MNRFFFITLSLAVFCLTARAQTTRDFAVDLRADVSATVPHITLSWTLRQAAAIVGQEVHRRVKGDAAWVLQQTLTTTSTTWADGTAVPGAEYEYWMRRTYTGLSPNVAMGYLSAGYALPMVEQRGKVLLVVDDTMVGPLGAEIDELKRDLAADGWTVVTITAPRRNTLTDVTAAADTKALIKAAYDADPANVKQVYVLGHVPVPYSGSQAPDGHGNHSGAWSADGFYGDMNGTWTDTSVTNTSSTETRINNIPGDGKLDQSTFPSPLELAVGRVDMWNMQRAPSTTVSEAMLLRRYLRKAHDFKRKQGPYASVERRVLIRDGFGLFSSESFMRSGWSWGFTTIGRPPEVSYDEAPSGNWWTQAAANNYLMANGNGGGSYETCGSVGASVDFGRRPFRAAFVSLFGSYFGDWDSTNNFMRAPLAGNATGDGLGLCCFWAGRPTFFMHNMATGESLGYAIRQSLNSQFTTVSNPVYTPINFPGGGTHLGLMGDPSLRMHGVEPPRRLTATTANGSVSLAWTASTETNLLGYHVYRAATEAGPFTRLTTTALATPSYTDATVTPGSSYTFMARTLKNEISPGGSYENLSLGEMITVTASGAATAAPANATLLSLNVSSAVSAVLSWQDNSADETGFRVERKIGPGGAFTSLGIQPTNTTTFTDTGSFSNNEVYYYRVIALNAAGNAPPSNVASFEAVPGYFEFDVTRMAVSKTAGTALIPVKRFGGLNGPVSVNFATSNTNAIAGTHYTATSGTVTWEDGETGFKNIVVPITNIPTATIPRQFRVTLSTPSAGTGIGTYNAISVVIEDPTATLPGPWQQTLVGSISGSSPAVQAEGSLSSTTIGGAGLSTVAGSEAGQFIYQMRSGDGVLTALVPAATPAQTGARYAVMIRETATAGGALMAGTVTSSSATVGTQMISRAVSGNATLGTTATSEVLPRWIRITRAGNTFSSASSSDGTNWSPRGTVTVPMASNAAWGLFHTSDDVSGTTYAGNFQTATFQNVTIADISVPGTPGSFTATQPFPGRVALTWTAGATAAGYRIERRSENGSFAQLIDVPGGTLSFNDDGVATDAGYEYRVFAYNSTGSSPASTVLQVVVGPGAETVTLNSDLSTRDATVKAAGAAVNFGTEPNLRVSGANAAGSVLPSHKIYLKFDLASVPLASLASAKLKLAVAGMGGLDRTNFTFSTSLRMIPDGNDGWTEDGITWATAPFNNQAGTGLLTGTSLLSSLSVTDALTVPSVGNLLLMDVSVFTLQSLVGADNLVTLALTSTTPEAYLEFASREHASLPGPMLVVSYPSTRIMRPAFLTATPGVGSAVQLAWVDTTSTETGFELQRRTLNGEFVTLQSLPADSTSFADTTTVLGNVYQYRLRATSANGPSAWTLVVQAEAGGATGTSSGVQTFADYQAQSEEDGSLMAYALGTPEGDGAGQGTSQPVIAVREIAGQRYLTLSFARRIDAVDVDYAVEVSGAAVGPWTELDPFAPVNQAESAADTPAVGWQTLVIKDTQPMDSAQKRFMRLAVKPRVAE